MGLISLFFTNPVEFLLLAAILLYSVILHEISHGWVAKLFGDDTAARYGRLTLNPLSHLDPMGTLMLFLVGFGWAKPVPVDYYRLKNTRLGFLSVALAGCAANILIAIVCLFILRLDIVRSGSAIAQIMPIAIKINIILGAFNLIPIPPLDGSRILMSFLPQPAQQKLARLEPYGFFILIALLFTGMLDPVIIFMQGLIYGFIGLLFSIFK